MGGDPREHILEPGKRVHHYQFTGGHEAAQHGCGSTAAVAAEERPVIAAHGPTTQRTLRVVVVESYPARTASATMFLSNQSKHCMLTRLTSVSSLPLLNSSGSWLKSAQHRAMPQEMQSRCWRLQSYTHEVSRQTGTLCITTSMGFRDIDPS